MPVVADAAVRVRGDLKEFNQDLAQGGEQGAQTLAQKFKGVFSKQNLARIGMAGGLALAGAVTAGLVGAAKALIDIERLNAQTESAIRSTGGVANVTREGVEDLAEGIESLTTIERESVQEGANLLLTFKNIRNEAGAGNDIFDQSTKALVDMSVAMGTDVKSGAIQLGKALNDPIAGIAALNRVGITFSDTQKDMIKGMVEAGDIMGAQKIILAELESQFGGSAEAFADTTAGKIARFQNDVGNMFESIILGAVKVGDSFGAATAAVGGSLDEIRGNFQDNRDAFHGWVADVTDGFIQLGDQAPKAARGFSELSEAEQQAVMDSAVHWEQMQGIYSLGTSGIATTIEGAAEDTRTAAQIGLHDPVLQEMLEAEENANKSGYQVVLEYAKGLLTPQTDVQIAIDTALQVVEDEMSRTEEIAYLSGQKTILEEARGLASAEGKQAAVIAIDAALDAVQGRMNELSAGAKSSGYGVVTEYAQGMWAGMWQITDAANAIASKVSEKAFVSSEPKDHTSPLYGITKVGGNIVKTIAEGIYANLGTGAAAANALAGALVPGLGVPALAGAGASVGGTGSTTIFQLHVAGKEPEIGTKQDILEAWESMASFTDKRREL